MTLPALEAALGVPVRVVLAAKNQGLDTLRAAIAALPHTPPPPRRDWMLPTEAEAEVGELAGMLEEQGTRPAQSWMEASGLLMQDALRPEEQGRWPAAHRGPLRADQQNFAALGIDFPAAVIEARYAWVKRVVAEVVRKPRRAAPTLTDKVDAVVMHPVWGYVIFFGVMALVFQTIFTWAQVPDERHRRRRSARCRRSSRPTCRRATCRT